MKLIVFGSRGRIGGLVIAQALAAGHEVVAFARDPSGIVSRPGQTVVTGDVRDSDAVAHAVSGQDAMISALGHPHPRRVDNIYSDAARSFAHAGTKTGVRRLVVMSAMVADSTERTGLLFRHVILPLVLRDVWSDLEVAEDLYRASALEWTTVRAGRLTDGPATGKARVAVGLRGNMFSSVTRADVAQFMLDEVVTPRFVRQSPDVLG